MWALVSTVTSGWRTTSRISRPGGRGRRRRSGTGVQSCAMRPPRNGPFLDQRHPHAALGQVAGRHQPRRLLRPPPTPPDGWGSDASPAGPGVGARFTAARTRRIGLLRWPPPGPRPPTRRARGCSHARRGTGSGRPASTVRRNVNWCSVGEQAATTTRFRPCSRIFCSMSACPGSEHTNMCVRGEGPRPGISRMPRPRAPHPPRRRCCRRSGTRTPQSAVPAPARAGPRQPRTSQISQPGSDGRPPSLARPRASFDVHAGTSRTE